MNKYKLSCCITGALLFLLAANSVGASVIIGLNFGTIDDASTVDFDDTLGSSGLFWHGHAFNSAAVTTVSGITITTTDLLASKDNGVIQVAQGDLAAGGGVVFPEEVIYGTNDSADEGNALATFVNSYGALTFTSAQAFRYTFTLAAQRASSSAMMNVGGSWNYVNNNNADFTGGVSSDPIIVLSAKSTSLTASSTWNGSEHELVLQFGSYGDVDNATGDILTLNALHIDAQAIPEPGLMGLLLFGGGIIAACRRRRNFA